MEVLAQREGAEGVQNRLRMSDGFELFYRRWKAHGEAECAVVFVHGSGGHSGEYARFAQDLASNSIEVYAPDMRGYGNSQDGGLPRGDTGSKPERGLQDTDELVAFVRANHPGKKLFMMGHSGGANQILWYAAERPDSIAGLILAAPGVKPPASFNRARFGLRILFLRLFAPKKMIDLVDLFLPEEEKSGENFKMLQEDTLWTPKVSARVLFGTRAMGTPLKLAPRIAMPTLIIQGEADKWAPPEGSKELLEKLVAKDKTLRTFPGADHFFYSAFGLKPTSTHDPVKSREVAVMVSNWLKAH